jgi:folate-dependent phosphoribosylglycinamide formyltransferase PurN
MRVAALAGSLAAGVRIAAEVEQLPAVDVSIICCNVGMKPPFLRWLRELALLFKSWLWRTYTTTLWRYARSGKLIILNRELEDPESLQRLKSLECDIGLHATNAIYRQATIAAFRLGILNAHIGILPGYRGRSVAEWSVLQGDPTGITVFFIDSGIDTGSRIVLREYIPSTNSNNVQALKTMLFGCDVRLYRKALEALASEEFQCQPNEVCKGKRYYVMSRMFTKVVDDILGTRADY